MEYKYYMNHMLKKSIFFHYYKRLLDKTERFSKEELRDYKEKRLQKMVLYSYKYVPYYKKLFDKIGINPKDIKYLDDLEKIPMMDKSIVKENFKDLISKKCIKKLCKIEMSSGTTGVPSRILRDVHCVNFEQASLVRFWEKSGDNNFRRVVLRGNDVVPSFQTKPPFWHYNPVENELIMSSYHLMGEYSNTMVERICKFNPKVLYAYPSTAYLLAKIRKNGKCENMNFDFIFTSSEMLMQKDRELIEEAFGCKIYDWYGQSERVSAIYQCQKSHYHIVEDYSITELIDTEFGREVVGTSFFNYAMPLLRYRTGDIVEEAKCKCICGSNFRTIKEINGRKVSFIISKNGEHIPGTLLGTFLGKVSGIDEFQIIQEKIGEISIDIVRGKGFKNESVEIIKNDTVKRIGYDFDISVNFKDEIPMGANCKKSPFINRLMRSN